MKFEEIIEQARKGVKFTHENFTDDEYMTMRGNMVVFEDDVKIFANEWMEGKDWLKDGWSLYKDKNQLPESHDNPNIISKRKKHMKYKLTEGGRALMNDVIPREGIVPVRTEPKIQRNSSCPCESGKKYKKCCINKK